jgi:glycine/D-amino acid oxidase-like deaminating enzyme
MVVILGAGIAGAATAYYLSSSSSCGHGSGITLIDAVGPAAAASGNAGAFLSQRWGDGTKTEALHLSSFQLHETSAKELDLKSFHYVPTVMRHVDIDNPIRNDNGQIFPETIYMEGKSALVDPNELTNALVDQSMANGGKLMIGNVEDIVVDKDGYAREIVFDNKERHLLEDEEPLVVAMGPWSSRLEDWTQQPVPVEGVSSTFLQWHNVHDITLFGDYRAQAIFCSEDSNGCHLEVFQRPKTNNGGQESVLYLSGCGGSESISPATFRGIGRPHPINSPPKPNSARVKAALSSLKTMINDDGLVDPDTIGACIRPVSPDGLPIIGKVSQYKNIFIATAGGPWGITWGPIIGKIAASIILEEDPPIRSSLFSPERFNTLLYKTLMQNRSERD